MKRREFIINSALAIGGSALLTGCGRKKPVLSENQVAKRQYKDILVPLLGLGCMRLPMNGSEVDMPELEKMVEYCMAHGANYFDTAYMYVNGKSETAMGNVLKHYDRKSLIIADKSPAMHIKSKDDVRRIFDEQLKKCQTDYFDFYMVHNINKNTIDNYRNYDMYNQLMEFKKEGRVKYVGFSFHGTPEMLKEVAPEHPWDFAQLQINYLDWDVVKAKEQYDIVQSHNIPVTVMEPLRGGGLVNLSDKALAKLKEYYPDATPAAFGLRWAASRKNVITVLSGMSNLEQVKQNIQTFIDYKEMNEQENIAAQEVAKVIQSQGEINCTACKYCLEVCPRGINIPAVFSLYNQYKTTGNKMLFSIYYNTLDENERADKCISCNLCNTNCPQSLMIPDLLKKIDAEIKTFK